MDDNKAIWLSVRALPLIFQLLRVAQVVFDFLFKLGLRHHRIKRRLVIGALLWPDAMPPLNVLDSSLICYTLCKCQCSLRTGRPRQFGPKNARSVPVRIEHVVLQTSRVANVRRLGKADADFFCIGCGVDRTCHAILLNSAIHCKRERWGSICFTRS